MLKLKFYLKERHNPQFNNPYYVKLGQLTKKEAKKKEESIYGLNYILAYDTEEDYNIAIAELKSEGFNVQ
jgi:hypothetical protein